METLKGIDDIRKPDERNLYWAFLSTGKQVGLEDRYADISSIRVNPSAPEEVRSYFITLQNLCVYAWFSYDFYALVVFLTYTLIEMALKLRLPLKGPDKRTLKPLIGAGATRSLGYPLWTSFIQSLADATVQHCGQNIIDDQGTAITVAGVMQINNLLFRAEIFKVNLQAHYFNIMQQTFSPRGSNSDTRALVSIPFQHFLTSNYDPALETAHSDVGKKYDSITLLDGSAALFLTGIANYAYPCHIVHVHGRYDDPQNIVLTTKEYVAFLRSSTNCENVLDHCSNCEAMCFPRLFVQ